MGTQKGNSVLQYVVIFVMVVWSLLLVAAAFWVYDLAMYQDVVSHQNQNMVAAVILALLGLTNMVSVVTYVGDKKYGRTFFKVMVILNLVVAAAAIILFPWLITHIHGG